jgi:hypothetical protein
MATKKQLEGIGDLLEVLKQAIHELEPVENPGDDDAPNSLWVHLTPAWAHLDEVAKIINEVGKIIEWDGPYPPAYVYQPEAQPAQDTGGQVE